MIFNLEKLFQTIIYKEENLEQKPDNYLKNKKTSKVVHTCNPRTWEAGDGDQDPDTENQPN